MTGEDEKRIRNEAREVEERQGLPECPHDCYRPGDCDGSCTHPKPKRETTREQYINAVDKLIGAPLVKPDGLIGKRVRHKHRPGVYGTVRNVHARPGTFRLVIEWDNEYGLTTGQYPHNVVFVVKATTRERLNK